MTAQEPFALSAAMLTPVGRGAVATVRVEGDLATLDQFLGLQSNSSVHPVAGPVFLAVNGKSLAQQSIGKIAFGRWGRDSSAAEDIVICRTQPQTLEIHCHGGDAAVRRILEDLQQAGCRVLDWQTQLALSTSLFDGECLEQLTKASTQRTAEILHEQSSGLLRDEIGRLIALADCDDRARLVLGLDNLLNWSNFGLRLSQPWTVVLTGRPNVGKSSLINALVGYERAIVFDQPGTTRDVVTAETAFDGWPVLLADTAGLRDAHEAIEAAGIDLARQRLKTAEARLVLIDLHQSPTDEDLKLIAEWPDAIVIGHKCDLDDCWSSQLPSQAIRASSVTGEGLPEIERRLIQQLIPHVPQPGTALPVSQRQVDLLRRAKLELQSENLSACRATLVKILDGRVAECG